MAHRFRPVLPGVAIVLAVFASVGHAQEAPRDPFANLEVRLARLQANKGSAIDARSLARAHSELVALQRAVASGDVTTRDARRRLARLSLRLRDLTQGGATARAVTAAAGTGSISGTVTADGGAPLANVTVIAFLIDDGTQTTTTDATGRYRIDGLVAGQYKVLTDNRLGFLDEIYQDTPCPLGACSWYSQGNTVVVTDGQAISGIDFVLSPGGRISGRVTDAATGAPIAGAQLEIASDEYGSITTVADADGRYVSATGLPAGIYRVDAWGPGYVTELFDDIPCTVAFGCDWASGTPIAVAIGAVTSGIDFALDKGGTISGRVTGSDSGAGIPGVFVYVFDAVSTVVMSLAYTDADGRYQALDGLPTGTYWLRVFAGDAGYLDEGYDNIPCDNRCSIPLGVTAVPVTLGEDTSGIDFALERGAVITGRVTDGNSGQPLPNVVVEAITTTRDPFWSNFGITDESGVYRIQALGTGTYRAFVDGRDGYLGEVWREIECYGTECFSLPGTPIAAQAGLTVAGIDFTPIKGGSITGTVFDHQTGAPLAGVHIRGYDSDGQFLFFSRVMTEADGRYAITGLPAGSFFLLTETFMAEGYVDELYGGTPCPSLECDVTRARPVRVAVGVETSGIDFRLDKGGQIAGRVTDAITGEPIAFASIAVYDSVTVRPVDFTSTDEAGRYTTRIPLPKGQFLVTAAADGYAAELYDDIACQQGCNGRLGTRVKVTAPEITGGIDFALTPLPASAALRVPPR
jgi:5-hydroxyisourate hydrolase-like protein (transthyretin family)